MQSETKIDHRLTKNERIAVFVSAFLVLAFGLHLALHPGRDIKEERDKSGAVVKSSVEPSNHKELSLLFTASGLALFFWGLNGLRLSKLTVGSVSAESKSPEVKAAEEYAKRGEPQKEVVVAAGQDENPAELVVEGAGTVVINHETEFIYPVTDLPRYVFDDLFNNWPKEYEKPKNLSVFEFASRKKGKGNHPWTIKFKDLPALKVSYGGQGKDSATVSVPQS
ncbi:hypothetical protein OPU71_21020 [Niveibacterium sp. 24ML]|uniref:hypothetical protein n=1 Tax=Niveibacterium sp. 24ML TaxID=2985512 RepID=UPI00226FCD07|nr:hypothetical protein [Niveibacterium sp. 24ML]MCX9158603.1 hypothetical protein [Niveibacterium sp. 24ML]